MATRHYCTLFDTFYMSRGLAMIESLLKHEPEAQIAVFAFDQKCEMGLKALALTGLTIVGLSEFETPDLLRVKMQRKRGEYCWTCTPFVITHCLEKIGWPECTYLDADLFFFESPAPAFEENPQASVLITEHRYTPRYDQAATSGIYCVQFMFFKKNADGLKTLRWWGDRCLEWCHDYYEDGKFGDQKYVDDWLTRFNGIHSVRHEGAGTAPWNVQQYSLTTDDSDKVRLVTTTGDIKHILFYHFHGLKLLPNEQADLGPYALPSSARQLLYRPYLIALARWQKIMREHLNLQVEASPAPTLYHKLRRGWAGFANIMPARNV